MQGIPDGLIEVAQVVGEGMVGLVADKDMLTNKRNIHDDEHKRDQPRESSLTTS